MTTIDSGIALNRGSETVNRKPFDVIPYLTGLLRVHFGDLIVSSWDSDNVDVTKRLPSQPVVMGGMLRLTVETVSVDEGTRTHFVDFDDEHRHFEGVSADVREYRIMPILGAPAIEKDAARQEGKQSANRGIPWDIDGQIAPDRATLTKNSPNYQHRYIR